MIEDFTVRLERELQDAADRDARRGELGRALGRARGFASPGAAVHAVGVATAVGLVLVAALWMVSSLRPEPAAPARPRVIADVAVAGTLGHSGTAAFGSVWVSDRARGDVLRIDPSTRRVTARVHVGGVEAVLAAGHGSIWAMVQTSTAGTGPFVRIDPRTNRIVARITVRLAEYPYGWYVLAGRRLWVVGQTAAVGVDPARNRIVAAIHPRGAFQFVDALVVRNQLVIVTGDRRLTRYDDESGRRLGAAPLPSSPDAAVLPSGRRLVVLGARSAALVDITGRALWRSALPATGLRRDVGAAGVASGHAYVVGQGARSPRDHLVSIDVRDGRVAPPVTLPEFGTIGVVGVGDDAWLLTGGGHVVVVRP